MDFRESSDEVIFLYNKLSNAMAPKNKAESFNRTNIAFLIDESGSVTLKNFKIILSCCRKMIEDWDFGIKDSKPQLAVSLYTFDSKVICHLPLSSNKSQILNKIDDLPYNGGGTDTGQALLKVYNDLQKVYNDPQKFYNDVRPKNVNDHNNVIILMTDGDVNGAEKIIDKINKESTFSIRLVTIFMAMPVPFDLFKKTTLKEWQVVAFGDYLIMDKVFQYFQTMRDYGKISISEVYPSITSAKVYFAAAEIKGMRIEKYYIELFKDLEQVPVQCCESKFSEVMIENLEQNTTYKIRVCAQFNNCVKSAFSDFYSFTTLSRHSVEEWMSNTRVLRQKHKELLNSIPKVEIPKKLKEYGFKYLNILLIGLMGHGKSSFVNTCTSTFCNSYKEPARTNNDPNETVTTVFERVNILEGSGVSNDYIRVFDTPGIRFHKKGQMPPPKKTFESSNFNHCLEAILKGELKPGYREWDPIDPKKLVHDPTINDKIHAIAFIIDIVSITSDSEIEMVEIFLKKLITDFKYEPLIILTKCDLILQENLPQGSKGKLKDIWQDDRLRKYIKTLCEKIPCIQEKDILLFSNYVMKYTPEERDYERELLLLNILETLKQKAESFVQREYQKHTKVFDQNSNFIGTFVFNQETDTLLDVVQKIKDLIHKYYDEEDDSQTKFSFYQKIQVGDKVKENRVSANMINNTLKFLQLKDFIFYQDDGYCLKIFVDTPGKEKKIEQLVATNKSSLIKLKDNNNIHINNAFKQITVLVDGIPAGELRDLDASLTIDKIKEYFKAQYSEYVNENLSLYEDKIPLKGAVEYDSGEYILQFQTSTTRRASIKQISSNPTSEIIIKAKDNQTGIILEGQIQIQDKDMLLSDLLQFIRSDSMSHFGNTLKIRNFNFLKKGKYKAPVSLENMIKTKVEDILEVENGQNIINIKYI